jgi:hypothetical protein
MTPRTNIRIWWDASIQAYRLSSSWNNQLVDCLKSSIPATERSFDPQSKIWTYIEKHHDNLVKLLRAIGMDPVVVSRQQTEAASGASQQAGSTSSAPARSATLDSVLCTFMRTLPYDAAQAAYRKASMILHPDRGGSMEAMSALNVAWTRIEKELYPNK